MGTGYEPTSFENYLRVLREYWVHASVPNHDEDKLHELGRELDSALGVAALEFEFSKNKPPHLKYLYDSLRYMDVTPPVAASYCVQVEAVRRTSGRVSSRPYVDPRPPSNEILKSIRSALADSTQPSLGLHPEIPSGDFDDPAWRAMAANALGHPGDDEVVERFVIGRKLSAQAALPITTEQSEAVADIVFGHRDLGLDFL